MRKWSTMAKPVHSNGTEPFHPQRGVGKPKRSRGLSGCHEPQLEGFRRDFKGLAIGRRRKVSAADDLLLEAINRNAVVDPHRLALGGWQVAQRQDDRPLKRRPGAFTRIRRVAFAVAIPEKYQA